ncbi:MAG: tetratricopeptide repeat protein, partial [Terracidiphilus sp.]
MHETDRQIEQGLDLHRAGNVKGAADVYQKVLAQNPNQPDALYLSGCLAHQSGHSSLAVEFLDKAILACPSKAEYYYALGSALSSLGNYDLAESNLRQAIKLGSRAEFHTSLGMILKKQHRLTEVIEEFEAAVKLAADDADARYNLGIAQRAAGNQRDALTSLEKALQIRPAHVPALAALRQVLASVKRDDEASARLNQAMAPLRERPDDLCDLADGLQEAKDFEGAIEAYHRAIALGTESPRAWYACGCAEIAREDFASAIASFEEAIKLRPESLEARHNLARALYEMGQVTQAYEEFKMCAARSDEGARLARAVLAVIAPGAPQANNEDVLRIREAWVDDLPTDELSPRMGLPI